MFDSGASTDGVVVLTPFVAADAPFLRDGDRDAELRLRFGFPKDFVPSIEHSLAVVSGWQAEREAGTRLTFAARDAAAGTLLGGCELRPLGSGAANLPYWTYPPHRNRGIASRAIAIAIRLAFADLKIGAIRSSTSSTTQPPTNALDGHPFQVSSALLLYPRI
jgi:RimJ/RimL family protein N-acetyltransferase